MLKNLKGDILGGIVSAFIALPLTLACGVLLFKGISGFDNIGINAAIFSAIIASFISAFIGSHSLQVSGPRVVTTLILSDFLYNFYHTNIGILGNIEFSTIFISLIMTIVVLSGIFQLIFSFFKVGELIKFLPISVTMGVSTTIGLLIILKQIPILFNYEEKDFFTTFLTSPTNIFNGLETVTLLCITIVMILLLFSKDFLNSKLSIFIPLLAPFLGIILFLSTSLDSSEFFLSKVNIVFPDFINIIGKSEVIFPLLKNNIADILLTSLSIALMGTLSSLLSVSILENKMSCRNKNTHIELKGQGIGNIVSGLLGGTTSSGSEARGLSNYNAGGRTPLSVIIHSLTLTAIVFIFNSYLIYIPVVILSALLIHTGMTMISPLFNLAKRGFSVCLSKPMKEIKECIKDTIQTFSIVLVMLITVYFENVSTSIVSGFAMASLIFIFEMMKSSIFKIISGNIHHSRKVRHEQASLYLKENGNKIKIIELEGAIFFGTADSLRKTIDSLNSDVKWLILDFKKVSEMDITGAEIIKLCIKENKAINFSLSNIIEGDDSYQALCSAGVIGEQNILWFSNTDLALEYTEDEFLKENNILPVLNSHKLNLDELSITKQLDIKSLTYLSEIVIEKEYKKGTYLFKESDKADELFLLRKGLVSIKTKEKKFDYDNKDFLDDNEEILYSSRRVTFSPGVVFGEMAFFENSFHSVEAIADENVSVYIIKRNDFKKMNEESPLLVQQLLFEFCKHLSLRLREVTKEVQLLEK